jgi:hypothetical protein
MLMVTFVDSLIEERTEGFAGREWVFEQVDNWVGQETGDRFFLLEGEPGSGKTALAARLTQFGRGQAPAPASCSHLAPRFLSAVHFCSRQDSALLEPQTFVESIALQLAGRYPAYLQALAELSGESAIRIEQHVGKAAAGASVIGMLVRGDLILDLGGLSPEQSFVRTLVNPLAALYRNGFSDPIVILIDSLDEAALYTDEPTIITLLKRVGGLPAKVRFMVTSRPNQVITRPLTRRGATVLSLSAVESRKNVDGDIEAYTLRTVAENPHLTVHVGRGAFVREIQTVADGNFLVLRYLLPTLIRRGVPSLQTLQTLPSGLDEVYLEYIEEYGLAEHWARNGRILGTLIAAQTPLSKKQTEQLSGIADAIEGLRDVSDFLDFDKGQPAEERDYAIYHRSFAEFLLDANRSEEFHCQIETYHAAIADYFLGQYHGKWSQDDGQGTRDYGLRYTATHLNAVMAAGLPPAEQSRRIEQIVTLVHDPGFRQAHEACFNNLLWLKNDLDLALRAATATSDIDNLSLVFRASLGFEDFRRRALDPGRVFSLAARGDVDAALRRLSLFPAEPRWLDTARLLCIWLGFDQNRDAGGDALARLEDAHHIWPFDQLRDMVKANFGGTSASRYPLPAPPDQSVVHGILVRVGGINESMMEGISQETAAHPADDSAQMLSEGLFTDYRREAATWSEANALRGLNVGQGPDEAPVYIATRDGAPLVSFAHAHGEAGAVYFEQYRRIHAANQYRHYRDLSLWILLEAVLRHPDDQWVREQAAALALAALAETETPFPRALPLVLTVLTENDPGARVAVLERNVEQIIDEGQSTHDILDDLWGYKRRLFGMLAEIANYAAGADSQAKIWLDRAQWSEGYAGFQYAARLAMAESALICGKPELSKDLLYGAEVAAQNIQDAVFCLRSTARVQALKTTWWTHPLENLDDAIETLATDLENARFASHFVRGQTFHLREDTEEKVALPPLAYSAQSLDEIGLLFRCSRAELERLNPDLSPENAVVRVPDAELPQMIATRLAAEVLIDPAMRHLDQRLRLILQLVPVVADDPSRLDILLARLLLLAARQIAPDQLAQISEILARHDAANTVAGGEAE